jgi:hypothetical protein
MAIEDIHIHYRLQADSWLRAALLATGDWRHQHDARRHVSTTAQQAHSTARVAVNVYIYMCVGHTGLAYCVARAAAVAWWRVASMPGRRPGRRRAAGEGLWAVMSDIAHNTRSMQQRALFLSVLLLAELRRRTYAGVYSCHVSSFIHDSFCLLNWLLAFGAPGPH